MGSGDLSLTVLSIRSSTHGWQADSTYDRICECMGEASVPPTSGRSGRAKNTWKKPLAFNLEMVIMTLVSVFAVNGEPKAVN